MKHCEVIRDLIPLYVDGCCSENTRTLVEEHLAVCPACKEEYDLMKNAFTDKIAKTGSVDYDIIEAVKLGIEGDYENGLIFCSSNVDKITKISSVKDVFEEFTV